MKNSYLGPSYSNNEIKEFLKNNKIKYKFFSKKKDLVSIISKKISKGKVIGWFQGKMEFGPRALGNRSIIADPRSEKMQKNINLKIMNLHIFVVILILISAQASEEKKQSDGI